MNFRRLLALVLLVPSVANAGWSSHYNIVEVFFEGKAEYHKLVIKFDSDFHSCGWNRAVNIRHSDVGDVAFKSLASIAIAATFAQKPISVNLQEIDGKEQCDGDRGQGVALRVKP